MEEVGCFPLILILLQHEVLNQKFSV